jgi:hypothetical protein
MKRIKTRKSRGIALRILLCEVRLSQLQGKRVVQLSVCLISQTAQRIIVRFGTAMKTLSLLVTKFYSVDQVLESVIGRASSTYERQERCIQSFGVET